MPRQRPLRYEFPIDDGVHTIPEGKVIAACTSRYKEPDAYRWFEVWVSVRMRDEHAPHTRKVQVIGTGHFIPSSAEHLVSWSDGAFVWHLYDVTHTEEHQQV